MARRNSLFVSITVLGIFISLIGLIAIYNASVVEAFNDFHDKYYFVKQQSVWLIVSLIIYFITSRLPSEFFKKIAAPFFLFSLLTMVLVLIPGLGMRLQGARRWISLGLFRFQPSELLKASLVIYLASWLETPKELRKFAALMAACFILVLAQPDMGTGIIIALLGFGMFFVAGSSLKEIVIFIACLALGIGLLIISSPYRLERLRTFIDPTSDTLGRSYHINQVLIGLGSGGAFGVGLGRSRQKYAYLPEATTDSIFTIIGEEMGFVGGVFLIALLLSLSLIAFKVASGGRDQHERLLAAGVALLFFGETFVNLSSMVALAPLTGVPLPLISYGGSSLITSFFALGILASIARRE